MNILKFCAKKSLAVGFIFLCAPLSSLFSASEKDGKILKLESMNGNYVLDFVKPLLPNNPVILEAGGYDGNDSVRMSLKWPEGKIYTFEPVPELFKKMSKRCKKLRNINCYHTALSDKQGSADFFVSERKDTGELSHSSSLFAPTDFYEKTINFLQFQKKITVPVETVDLWAKKNNVKHIDFMWLDVQGGELALLKGAKNLLSSVRLIYAEVEWIEAYKVQPLYKDVKAWLTEQGFRLYATDFDEKSALEGREIKNTKYNFWGNALFINRRFDTKVG